LDYVYGAQFAAQGFHVLLQSSRGTGGSGGSFAPWRHEGADGQATLAWLRQQDWFSGTLGCVGTSYQGYAAWDLAAGSPPELRAVVADGSVDPAAFFYPGGVFALEGALTGAAGYLFSARGLARFTRAVLRLRRQQRTVARTLPLIDAYPAALGGPAPLFEQWLTSAPLADDLEILGLVSARLLIVASNRHHDVFARLCDVDPRGRSRNVCDGLIRSQPADLKDGDPFVTIPMSATAYRFSAGHRIRLQVSGGAHPRYARNAGAAEPLSTTTRLVATDIQILHDPGRPGALSLPVTSGLAGVEDP
jgi:predicted acyl esterase